MKASAVKPNPGKPRRPAPGPSTYRKAPAAPPPAPSELRLGMFFLWLLILLPPFLLAQVAKESFREPKLLASGWLALASAVCFAGGLRRLEEVRPADLWRLPAARIVLPILAVATAGLAVSRHPAHTREGLADLWIGAVCLVAWSAALPASRLERLLRGMLWPAALLAAIGIGQFHGWWQPLEFFGLTPGSRLAITSYAGNPGDLGAYLVLPVLIAQETLWSRLRAGDGLRRPAVWSTAAALAVCLYALLLTQTIAAAVAALAGSVLLWGSLLPRRRAVALLAGGIVAAVLVTAAVPSLRQRVVEKAQAAAQMDLNWFLSGRLDGWRTAVWMLRQHPLTGVGHGAFRPEFVPAKIALLDRGVRFFPGQTQVVFANAHEEILEAGAEWGLPGLLALAWGGWVLLASLRASPAEARPLARAGVAALVLLSLAYFPFRVALVAFPSLLFLSWVLRRPEEAR